LTAQGLDGAELGAALRAERERAITAVVNHGHGGSEPS
jgi:hypothetical protein